MGFANGKDFVKNDFLRLAGMSLRRRRICEERVIDFLEEKVSTLIEKWKEIAVFNLIFSNHTFILVLLCFAYHFLCLVWPTGRKRSNKISEDHSLSFYAS